MGRLKYSVRKFINYLSAVNLFLILNSHIPEIMKNLHKIEFEPAKTKVKDLIGIKQRY